MHTARDTGRARADNPAIPSRRGMLAAGAAALVAGAAIEVSHSGTPLASPGGAGDDAELVALGLALARADRDTQAIQAEGPFLPDGITEESEDQERRLDDADDRWWAAATRISVTAARTLAGMRVKAEAMQLVLVRVVLHPGDTMADLENPECFDMEHRMAWSLARDLLAGEGFGMNATPETTLGVSWAISDIEPLLGRLETVTGFLGHLAGSEDEVLPDQLRHLETDLIDLRRALGALWHLAWDQAVAERKAHAAALTAAKARTAAPGSPADLAQADAIWSILRSTVKVAAQACEEARPALSGLAALAGHPPRVLDAPDDPDAPT